MKNTKLFVCLLAAASLAAAETAPITIFSAQELKADAAALRPRGPISAAKDLARYSNHLLLLAKRVETGSSELHAHDADIFVVESGDGAILAGGKIIGGRATGAGEIRGTGVEGAKRYPLHAGDVVHIPAGVAHQVLLNKGEPFVYFVVKVSGQ